MKTFEKPVTADGISFSEIKRVLDNQGVALVRLSDKKILNKDSEIDLKEFQVENDSFKANGDTTADIYEAWDSLDSIGKRLDTIFYIRRFMHIVKYGFCNPVISESKPFIKTATFNTIEVLNLPYKTCGLERFEFDKHLWFRNKPDEEFQPISESLIINALEYASEVAEKEVEREAMEFYGKDWKSNVWITETQNGAEVNTFTDNAQEAYNEIEESIREKLEECLIKIQ